MTSLLSLSSRSAAQISQLHPSHPEPCANIAGQQFVVPKDALACLKSFPFNETLRQNVLSVVGRVFDFYTFESFYLNSPPPFQESTVNIRAELARLNHTVFKTDYDFNRAVYDFVTQLNDGHTRWVPNCHTSFQNVLPAPLANIEQDGTQEVFVVPDLVDFINLIGPGFTSHFDQIGFDWQRLQGARVLEIEGMDPYAYADLIATTETGTFLDHGARVNSVFSGYRIDGTDFAQRLGDIAGSTFPDKETLTMKLVTVNSTRPETVVIPWLAVYRGSPFTDQASFWAANCAATSSTNGQDFKKNPLAKRKLPRAEIASKGPGEAIGLPTQFQPKLPSPTKNTGVIKSYILPGNRTGVLFVGSFSPDDPVQFELDTAYSIQKFQAANITNIIVDVTTNGGGIICLGEFLHVMLTGIDVPDAGFQSTSRANPLAQKILKSLIALNVTASISQYTPDNWAFVNGTKMPLNFNYNDPSATVIVNGVRDFISQRFTDACPGAAVPLSTAPPFDLKNVAIVGNGNCASTCAMFATNMFERHNVKMVVFGGKPGEQLQYKGEAGNQVLEWVDLDNEIKTANLKDDPLAPPDLLVSANMRHNWRTAYSNLDEKVPIAYKSELPQFRFPYTKDTYNNPQNLWMFVESKLFPVKS